MYLIIRFTITIGILFFPFVTNADGITSISKTNKLLKQGEEAFKKRDFKTAILAYESAIKESSEVPAQANMNLGSAYFQIKDYTKAQKNYQNAAASLNSPGLKSVAFQQIGNIFSEQKDFKSALDWYKKSLKANPLNESARFNFELAYKLNKKAEEEEKKNNPNKDNKEDKKDQKQDQKQGQDQKNDQKGEGKDQKGKEDEKKDQKSGDQQKGKDQDSKDGKDPKKGDDPNAPETDKESAVGKEKDMEEKDKDGKEESKNKKEESNVDDPNALRVDKKKLQETGLSEEQAKSLLEAMKQSEVKYLQQRRFKSPKGGSDKNKQRW